MNLNFTLIAQAIAFAILIWFTIKFVWPPLLNAIEKRQKEIADGLAAAQEGKLSLEVAAKKSPFLATSLLSPKMISTALLPIISLLTIFIIEFLGIFLQHNKIRESLKQ